MYNKNVRSLIAKTLLGTALGVTTGFVAMSTAGTSAWAAGAVPAKHAMTTKHAASVKHAMPARKAMSARTAMSHSATRDALFAAGKFDSASIEKALHGVPGIVEMNANSKNKHVWARYNPSKTSSEKIEAALRKAGAKPEAIRKSSHSKMGKHTSMKTGGTMTEHASMKRGDTMTKNNAMKKSSATPAKKMSAKMMTKTVTTKKATGSKK